MISFPFGFTDFSDPFRLEEQYDFIDSLNATVRISLHEYTGPDVYMELNRKLGNGDYSSLTPKELRIIKDLDAVFRTIPPLTKSIDLYRGYAYFKTNFRGYTSTTYNFNSAVIFTQGNDCCLFTITAVPGTKVIPLDKLSDVPAEKEVLLGRDTRFTPFIKRIIDNIKSYSMTTIPEKSVPVTLDITLSDDMVADTVEDWVDRIVELCKEWDLDNRDSILYMIENRWKEEAPEGVIDLALEKIAISARSKNES